jgi:hypothetical protein
MHEYPGAFLGTSCASGDPLIADTATERGLEISAE